VTARMEIAENNRAEQWRDYRRKRTAALLFGVGAFLTTGALALAIHICAGNHIVLGAALVTMTLAYIAYGVAIVRFHLWKCPRCGRRFIGVFDIFSFLRRKCFHCGLPVGHQTGGL